MLLAYFQGKGGRAVEGGRGQLNSVVGPCKLSASRSSEGRDLFELQLLHLPVHLLLLYAHVYLSMYAAGCKP